MLGWAVVLAFILHPLHERLTRRLKGRRALSAGILTTLTPFLVLAPLSVLTGAFVGQVTRLIEYLRGHSFLSFPSWSSACRAIRSSAARSAGCARTRWSAPRSCRAG